MKNFMFTFLISALVLCAGLNVSFGSHEIQKFDKVKIEKKIEKKSEMKTVAIVEVENSSGLGIDLINYIVNRKYNVVVPERKVDLLVLPYQNNVRQVDINKGASIKLCHLAKKYMSRSTC